jgi:hypothetical protein
MMGTNNDSALTSDLFELRATMDRMLSVEEEPHTQHWIDRLDEVNWAQKIKKINLCLNTSYSFWTHWLPTASYIHLFCSSSVSCVVVPVHSRLAAVSQGAYN